MRNSAWPFDVGALAAPAIVIVCASAHAQPPPVRAQETLEMRVTALRGRVIVVDRGSSDGLRVGDRVRFRPLGGALVDGDVVETAERSASIELLDPSVVLAPGTRGDCSIPSERLAPPVPPIVAPDARVAPPAPSTQPGAESQPSAALDTAVESQPGSTPPEHAPWTNQDDEYVPGAPLLSRVVPLRPEQRPRSWSGRVYSALDHLYSSEGPHTGDYDRLGASVRISNATGRGDSLFFDGELNHRDFANPDDHDDDSGTRLRVDRLAYAWGGTRYSPERWNTGRFLQEGMPEFGVLDGVEWGTRRDNGDRYGFSIGLLPEPTDDYAIESDLQFAAYYRWVSDASERTSLAAGFQQTLHAGKADRDLFVANVAYSPPDGWNAHATAWVDLYTGDDEAKGAGVELTQVYASTSRVWDGGSALNLVYTHLAFPLTEHDEFEEVTAQQLADDRVDRVSASGRRALAERLLVHAAAGLWRDEDDGGGDGECGVELRGWLFDTSRIDVTAFGTVGRFETSAGGRLSFGGSHERGRWSVDYEYADHKFDDFSPANNELPQHRLRAGADWAWLSGWNLSADVSAVVWSDETSYAVSVYLQKDF